jgi:ssDNA-specific exonuclease RecJ
MNEHLKTLGRLAGLNRKVSQIRFRGAQRLENIFPLYEVLTTHVARKTFITNSIYLGMNSEAIMEITGQKTRQTFKRYFKIVDQFKEVEMRRTWNTLT